MLRGKGISYIVVGKSTVNLVQAVYLLREHFVIRTLLLEGGGHIRGGFLQAGLVDEVSGFVQTPMEPAKFSSRKRNAMPT